ncbi:gliding motility-associated C-terminal domain-containing protein [Maribacter sp. 2308TA10-17]|uniref:T9SS type B sorting domain-containing protein n=1 Tax=Maribacter sp. 2308TA10-17 TaxID=3386276 RepID=UPI0039BC2AD3
MFLPNTNQYPSFYKRLSLFAFAVLLCFVNFSFSQVPSNDDFSNPIDLTGLINNCSSDAAYTTLNATPDLNAGSCWADGPNANVWFSFVATATGTIQVNMDRGNTKGDLRFAYMTLWDADCVTELACSTFVDAHDDISLLYSGLTSGGTYHISVDRRYTTVNDDFTLCLSDQATNDYLEGATNIDAHMNGCSADAEFSTLAATRDRNAASCWPNVVGPGPYRNVWFAVTAPSTGTIEVKLDRGGVKGMLRTAYMALWEADGITEVSCNSYRIGSDYDDISMLATGLITGNIYYISVDNTYINEPDDFTLCLSDQPTNDYYEGATNITSLIGSCSADEAFTTLGNTFDRNTGSCWPAPVEHNTWFQFTAPSTGRIEVNLDSGGAQGTLRHAYMALWDTDGTTELACTSYVDPDDDLSMQYLSLTAGNTYYVSVDNRYVTTTETFALCLDALYDYDFYEGAHDVTSLINSCSADEQFSTVGATPDRNAGSNWNNSGPLHNRWFRFTAPPSGEINVVVDRGGTKGAQRYTQIALWESDGTTEIKSEQYAYQNEDTDLGYVGLTPGNTYYISVDVLGASSVGTFTLCLQDEVDYDFYEGAIDITSFMNSCSPDAQYDTRGATPDRNAGSDWGGGPGYNRWFKFTAPTTGQIHIVVDVQGVKGTQRYSKMALWEADGLTEIRSERWHLQNGDIDIGHIGLVPGNEYFISVDAQASSSAGTFTMCIQDQVDYDFYEGARNITSFINNCSPSGGYDTRGASADLNPGTEWGSGPVSNRWFQFVAPTTGEIHIVVNRSGGTAQRYALMALWEADGVTEVTSERFWSQNDNIDMGWPNLVPGNTYYISVDGVATSSAGTFNLCLQDRVDYDFYEGAEDITGYLHSSTPDAIYSTYGASPDRSAGSNWNGGPTINRWFSFTAPVGGERMEITLDIGGAKGTQQFSQLALWQSDGTTEIASARWNLPDDDITLAASNLVAGNTYYISVDAFAISSAGSFTLSMQPLGPDLDGDGVSDIDDLDDDNDGILDVVEGCENTDIDNTVGIGNNVVNSTYNLVGTDLTYTLNNPDNVEIFGYDAGLNGHSIRLRGDSGQSGTLTSEYSTPISHVFFKMADFDNNTRCTINVFDENNVLYDLTFEGVASLGSIITQTGNLFVADAIDVDGNNPAEDMLGSIVFYFERQVSRIELNFEYPSDSSTRFTQPIYCISDSDNDGLTDHRDLDSDNDGLPDNVEAQTTIGYVPPNSDDAATYLANNGVNSAYLGGLTPTNTDTQDNPDYLDIDSDNEGGTDTTEAQITLLNTDSDNDGLDDATDATSDYSDVGGTIDNPLNAPIALPDSDSDATSAGDVDFRDALDDSLDTDNDGVSDSVDLDDDNDGILDSSENTCPPISAGQNLLSNTNALQNANTVLEAGIKYNFNIENVSSSGILSGVAIDGPFAGENINIYLTNTTEGGVVFNGLTAVYNSDFTYNAGSSAGSGGLTNGGFYVFYAIVDTNSNGTYENGIDELVGPVDPLVIGSLPISTATGDLYFYYNDSILGDNLANIDYGIAIVECDADGDGVPNSTDLDTDNDGILDIIEAGHSEVDADNDGQIDGSSADFGANGLFNSIESDDSQGATVTYSISESSDDIDTIPDFLDLDSDGDGIPDNVEAQTTLGYVAPTADDVATYLANDGVNSSYLGGLNPTNTDTTDDPDYLDVDSDNEGGTDTLEAQITLLNIDSDNDGLDDATDATPNYSDVGGTIDDPLAGAIILLDTDKDANSGGDVDFRDAQDDRLDTDTDGIADAIDLDDDNDGILDSEELNVIIGNTQPDCTGETILDFSTAPILESGTALMQGAVYRFPNVTAGSDALVTIVETFNASVADIDNNSAEAQAFRPRTAFDISNVGKEGYIEYRIQFVNSGGTTPVIVSKFFINVNDTDGNVDYSEEIYVENPTNYIISNPSDLSVSYEFPWIVATGGTNEYPGAGNTNPQANFGINYENRSEIRFRAGITTIVPAVAASGREHNLDFRCTTNYINPEIYVLDSDEDGYPNPIDLDSDNDGVLDVVEAGHGQTHSLGRILGSVGADGIPDSVQSDPDTGMVNYAIGESIDDIDIIPNYVDLDADGDGIPDNVEAQTTIGYLPPDGTVDSNGVDTAYPNGLTPTNTDSQDNPDYLDINSDNEGGDDTVEMALTLSGNDVDNDGLDDATDTTVDYSDAGGTIDNLLTAPIIAPDNDDDATTGGDVDFRDAPDNDNDGIPDDVDMDDDNDGIPDDVEDIDNDGDNDPSTDPTDTDNDGVWDYIDLDADNDGIPDNVEAQTTVGYIAPNGVVNANGFDTAYPTGIIPTNTDGMDTPDYIDTDSDNESGNDTEEAGITLTGNDADNDGLDDATDATPDYTDVGGTIDDPLTAPVILPDLDNDANTGGDVDFRDSADDRVIDLDSDDDGILDSFEDLNEDGDNDPSTNPTNSDGDANPDYLDIDSDDDGIPDNVEAQTTPGYISPSLDDTNNNGVDDAYETGGNIGIIPVNTDGEDLPDYLDTDSDNDNVPDSIEGNDANHDGIPDVVFIGSDKDNDGLDDSFEGTDQIDIDVNDEIDDPLNDLPNTDGDNEPDYRDIDDDDDEINTIDEDINGDGDYANDDTDFDGTPDYLDPDPPLALEDVEVFNVVTPNGDGAHDYLIITGLDLRSNNTLEIYNRWGILIYSTTSYNSNGNAFDGTSKARATYNSSEKLPVGTYFYILNYEDLDGSNKTLSGHLYLN